MDEERITIELEGKDEESGVLRLNDFIAELHALSVALRRTQQEVTDDPNSVSYRVAALSYASPYRVTVAIAPKTSIHKATPSRIARRFTSSLRMVKSNHRYARNIDPDVLDSFKALTAPVSKGVKSVKVFRDNEKEVRIDHGFSRNLDLLRISEQSERDEICGRLEQLNIHNRNQFHIYPMIGPKRILCKAPVRLRGEIIASVGSRVMVEGTAHYRKDAPFPHEMDVTDIYPLPSDDKLPKLSDLHGIAPNATGELSPEDFIREFRNARW